MPDSPEDVLRRLQGAPERAAAPAAREGGGGDLGAIWEKLQKAPEQAKPQEPPGKLEALWEGLKRGALDVLEGGAKIGARMGPEEGAGAFTRPEDLAARQQAVQQQAQQSAEAYAKNPAATAHPLMAGGARLGANMAATAPLMAIPGGAGMSLGGRAALGAGQGAMASGLLSGGDPKQTAIGAGLGGGLGAAGAAIGPALSQAYQKVAQAFPNLMRMATGAEGRTSEAFQRATANEVLTPIGQSVPRTVKPGHDLVNQVGDKLEDAYNAVLPKVTFRATATNEAGETFLTGLRNLSEEVPEAHAGNFTKLMKQQFESKLDEAGNMAGKVYKDVDSTIGKLASEYSSPRATPDDRLYASVLRNLQAMMRDTLSDTNPTQSKVLQSIDTAWARYVRMQEAAGRRIDAKGTFEPIDLLMASRNRGGARAFSHGDRVMQSFGEAGHELLAGGRANVQKIIGDLAGIAAGGAVGHAVGGPFGAAAGGYMGHQAGASLGPVVAAGVGRARSTPGARELGAAVSRTAPVAAIPDDREPHVSPAW